jgi:hypothetical protein
MPYYVALKWPAEPIPFPLPTLYQGHSPIDPCGAFWTCPKAKFEDVNMFLHLKKYQIKL